MIEGLVRLMDSPDDFVGPVNVGNNAECTILELAGKVIRLTGSHSKVVFKPLPQDDPIKRQPDLALAKEKLGFFPGVTSEEGLLKTVVLLLICSLSTIF